MELEDGEMPPPPPPLPPPPLPGYAQGPGGNGAAAGSGRDRDWERDQERDQGGGAGADGYQGPSFRSEQERKREEEEQNRWRVRASKVEEKHVDFEEAAYAECYPMQVRRQAPEEFGKAGDCLCLTGCCWQLESYPRDSLEEPVTAVRLSKIDAL